MRIGRCSLLLPLLSAGALSVLAGCPNRDVSAVDPSQAKEQQNLIPVSLNRNIDILFVVDDSGSMRQEQSSLVRNFPRFIEVLDGIEGGLPNIHMGVISSNVGTSGGGGGESCTGSGDGGTLLRGQADTARCTADPGSCPASPCPALTDGGRFIKDVLVDEEAGTRQLNYTGDLAQQFSCMAELGTRGCGFEQHLESMKRALDNNPDNAGFLRNDAFLAVIFIQDEDDCSAKDNAVFMSQGDNSVGSELGELSSFRCFEFGTTCEGPSNERQLGPRQNCTSEEDSQYMQSVQAYIDFLKGVKGDPSKVIVAAITADDTPVVVGTNPGPGASTGEIWVEPQCVVCPDGSASGCPLAPQDDPNVALVAATPGIRMKHFMSAFPQRATLQNICNYNPAQNDVDLSGALTQIALLLKLVLGNPCIEGRLTDPPVCYVADVQHYHQDNQIETPIPPCSEGGDPCYNLTPDPNKCSTTETQLTLEIVRSGDPPDDTTVVSRCLVE